MENNSTKKGILKVIVHPTKKTGGTPTLYVSPNNLEMLMKALLIDKYRPLVMDGVQEKYQEVLKEAIKLYDSGELYNFKIALVRSKDVLSMEKPNNINMQVKDYSTEQHAIPIGEHTLDGLKTYFDKKNLEQRIYSDYHIIE